MFTRRPKLRSRSTSKWSPIRLVVGAVGVIGLLTAANLVWSARELYETHRDALEMQHVRPVAQDDATTERITNRAETVKQRAPTLLPVYAGPRRTTTDTGVDVSSDALYQTVDLQGDSSSATVMGMASGYDRSVYERFVGTLRKTGYRGHIVLGVSPDLDADAQAYLLSRNVTLHKLRFVNCTYAEHGDQAKTAADKEVRTCADPYPDIKIRWSRFPLQRDWLAACATCTGPVLVADVRDTFFQLDPFGQGAPPVTGLQVYEEDKAQTTQHWLTKWPIGECKGIEYDAVMLCSGTTTGTRAAMLAYLTVMYEEMRVWIKDPKCRFQINGDDQSIHNYLYYSGQLPFGSAVENRRGGIVNTIGVEGANMAKQHRERLRVERGMEHGDAMWQPFRGASGQRWIGKEFNICDDEGWFIELDGSRSRVVHQWDRFGRPYVNLWMEKQDYFVDRGVVATSGASMGATTTAVQIKAAADKAEPPKPVLLASMANKPPEERRNQTDTGVDLTDPALYEEIDSHGDSSTATVMGMASGYDLYVYQRFVGSLRKSGFKGHIILGVAPNVPEDVLAYFAARNVTPKILQWVNCTYAHSSRDQASGHAKEILTCADPYPDIKIRWSRFPLARDWLRDCETCTGPVLVMDVRDSIFQRDPFGPGSPPIRGLQVYEEHASQKTTHWLAEWPIGDCKGVRFEETMLCSGTTTGTRTAMLKYLDIMYEEMRTWIVDPKCQFEINGDDQSIHNYLYYSGQLPFAKAVPNRSGGIVNTVGVEGANIWKAHVNKTGNEKIPYDGASGNQWIGLQFNVTDGEGFFTEFDGSRSRVIHQFDRYGHNFHQWLYQQDFIKDPWPPVELNEPDAKETENSPAAAQPAATEIESATFIESAVVASTADTIPEGSPTAFDRSLIDWSRGWPLTTAPNFAIRNMTDTGIDITDPELYRGVDLQGDSSTATVMGMASGYDIDVYHRFVGSLRKTGFKGHIILGVAPDVSERILRYFRYRNVTPKILSFVNCTYEDFSEGQDGNAHVKERMTCADPYPDIKLRWSRFPLQRDWLRDCETCAGPVLIMDVRDSLFQLDPFGPGSPIVKGLQVYEEHKNQTTRHWLTDIPLSQCKGARYGDNTMLCSGTTTGTRAAMLKYLEIMYGEMRLWINEPKCSFEMNGDDQSIHNHLYYSGQLPFATAMVNRGGGIVNTAGVEGAVINKRHAQLMFERHGKERGEAMWMPLDGAQGRRWIGTEFQLANDEGLFTDFDGNVSRVVHQWDRYGRPYVDLWLEKQDFVKDTVPVAFE